MSLISYLSQSGTTIITKYTAQKKIFFSTKASV